jgi:hypothetical protein
MERERKQQNIKVEQILGREKPKINLSMPECLGITMSITRLEELNAAKD